MAFEDMLDRLLNGEEVAKLKTYVAFIIDESGSMSGRNQEVIDFFNSQLNEIKTSTVESKSYISLVTFSDKVNKPIFWNKEVSDVKKLSLNDYKPNGMTALNDAIGWVVNKLVYEIDETDENNAFLIITITDGHENASKEFRDIKTLINDKEDTKKWTFVYLGTANIFEAQQALLGVTMCNTMSYDMGTDGKWTAGLVGGQSLKAGHTVNETMTQGIKNYYNARTMRGETHASSFFEDIDKTMKDIKVKQPECVDLQQKS